MVKNFTTIKFHRMLRQLKHIHIEQMELLRSLPCCCCSSGGTVVLWVETFAECHALERLKLGVSCVHARYAATRWRKMNEEEASAGDDANAEPLPDLEE